MPKLKYVGKDRNTDWLPGIPARDLTAAEAALYPQAEASVFYVPEKGETKKPRAARKPRVAPIAVAPAGPGDEEEQEN